MSNRRNVNQCCRSKSFVVAALEPSAARMCCKQHVLPWVPAWWIIAASVCCQSYLSPLGDQSTERQDDSRCNSKNMSYLFYALMICFPTICIRSTQHYKPQNATVIQCQTICLRRIEPYKWLVSLSDSQASNCNLLRNFFFFKPTHSQFLCKHEMAYIYWYGPKLEVKKIHREIFKKRGSLFTQNEDYNDLQNMQGRSGPVKTKTRVR